MAPIIKASFQDHTIRSSLVSFLIFKLEELNNSDRTKELLDDLISICYDRRYSRDTVGLYLRNAVSRIGFIDLEETVDQSPEETAPPGQQAPTQVDRQYATAVREHRAICNDDQEQSRKYPHQEFDHDECCGSTCMWLDHQGFAWHDQCSEVRWHKGYCDDDKVAYPEGD